MAGLFLPSLMFIEPSKTLRLIIASKICGGPLRSGSPVAPSLFFIDRVNYLYIYIRGWNHV
jgi:hypothetical protein